MLESPEKIYGVKDNNAEHAIAEALDIPQGDIDTLEIIAKVVGGDFGMSVKIGEPGGGSFFNTEQCSITLDPLHVKENPQLARFVAGHEGSHRAITPGPKGIGLSREKTNELYSQTGFGFLHNAIEDPAVNDWLSGRFPGLEPDVKATYDDMFREEGVVLGTPETQRVAQQLGYQPKFAQYGSEVIRQWHQGRFSQTLDEDVKGALDRTINHVVKSRTTIPNPSTLDRRQIVTTAQERFRINTQQVWPEVKKLVEMDIKTEETRQMMNDVLQQQQKLQEKEKALQDAQQAGDQEAEEQLKQEIEELKKELEAYNQVPEELRKELEEKIREALKEALEKLAEQIQEKQEQKEAAQKAQKSTEEEIEKLEQQMQQASGPEKDQLEKQLEKMKAEQQAQQGKADQARQEMDAANQAQSQMQSGESTPFPADSLSEMIKKELEKMLQQMSAEKQQQMREKAEKQMQEFEDKLNEELEGHLNEENPDSHEEGQQKQESSKQAAKSREQARVDEEAIKKALEKLRNESMTPYERTRKEVRGLIDILYDRLRRVLQPENDGQQEMGYPTGRVIDFPRAMQAEQDVGQKHKMWIRETEPERKDYRFWHLVDLSGSMSGKAIEETYKGFVVAAESIDRIEDFNSSSVTVHQGITGFHSRVFPYKDYRQRFTNEVENSLSTMPSRTADEDAGTDTFTGTEFALNAMKENLGESGNYMLTFSDGSPNQESGFKLKRLLSETKEERQRNRVKAVLIWLGESGDESQVSRMVREYGYDFGLVMPAVQEGGREEKKQKSFAERLGDLLEVLVRYPDATAEELTGILKQEFWW